MKNKQNCCIDNITTGKDHMSENRVGIQNSPEVFMMNLNWYDEPRPTEILKLLISIPEKFQTSQIYDKMVKGESTYVFKGMICY